MALSFKEKVLQATREIPKGKVSTYKRIASLAGKPNSWRAVGNILNKNKDNRVPCHRVVRSDLAPGGYNRGARRKEALLKKEGVIIRKQKVSRLSERR